MVKATRRGHIGERRNQDTQEDGAEDRSQLIDEPSDTEEVPYAKSSEEDDDDRSLATAMEREDSDVSEQEKPKQEEVEITNKEDEGMTESETEDDKDEEGLEKAQDNSSEAEIEPTEIKGMARKKQRKVGEETLKAEEHQDFDVIQLGSVRLPRIGQQCTSETSYEALVKIAQALQTLTDVVQRLINNQSQG